MACLTILLGACIDYAGAGVCEFCELDAIFLAYETLFMFAFSNIVNLQRFVAS